MLHACVCVQNVEPVQDGSMYTEQILPLQIYIYIYIYVWNIVNIYTLHNVGQKRRKSN